MYNSTIIEAPKRIGLGEITRNNESDTDQINQVINRNAWLVGIASSFFLPLLVLGFGYMKQHLHVAKEIELYSTLAKLEEQQHSQFNENQSTFRYLLDTRSLGSKSELSLDTKNINYSWDVTQQHIKINKLDGTSTTLVVSRSLTPVFNNVLIAIIPGILIGFLVFHLSRVYPRKMHGIAISEIERRTLAEQKLRTANSLFSAILESTTEGIVAVDSDGRIAAYNARHMKLWGLSENDINHDNYMHYVTLAAKIRNPKRFLEHNQNLLKLPSHEFSELLELLDGRSFEWTSCPQRINGKIVGHISTFRDVSESRRAEVLLTTENAVLEKVVQGAPLEDALFVVADAIERESGDMFCAILYCSEVHSTDNLDVVSGTSLPSWYRDELRKLNPYFCNNKNRHRKNDRHCIDIETPDHWFKSHPYLQLMEKLAVTRINLECIKSSRGKMIGLVLAHYRNESVVGFEHDGQLMQIASQMCSIAIDRYHSTRELDILAHYDFLTGLPNRKHFHDHLRKAISKAQETNHPLGLLFLDLDRFKAINDSLGHAAGDAMLKVVATRIRECVRDNDIIARLGGDEFVILIEDLQQTEITAKLAQKIVERMTESVSLLGHETFISASVGIALYPQDGNTLEELLKNADAAMYEVKGQGRNGIQFFHTSMNANGLERLKLEGQLRRAIERSEMTLHYQPKVQAISGNIVGAEALLRWQHPEYGLITPDKFVTILEETGLIVDFGNWITLQVCKDIQRLDQANNARINIAVNISARQFGKQCLVESLMNIVNANGINPNRLELEITESLLMQEPNQASNTLNELRKLGVGGIAIDDFGTGYSSLAYLKGFPITRLKIDRSFVTGIAQNNQDEAIVQAILAMAKSMNLEVTAEGVETLEQASALTAWGCHEIQGYYFGKPMPLEGLIKRLNDNTHCMLTPVEN